MPQLQTFDIESFRQLLSSLTVGAMLINGDGKIDTANSKICSMLQRAPADLVGSRLSDVLAELSSASPEIGADVEWSLGRADGSVITVIASSQPLTSNERLITFVDISRHKSAEESARQQYDHILQLSDTLLQQSLELKRYSSKLEDRVRERTAQLNAAHMEAIYMLAVASEAKDADTGRHVKRIENLARTLAKQMGLSAADSDEIGYSAILHDVGKIHIDDAILRKPGALDDDERRIMQTHTLAGEHILADSPFFDRARRIARFHHENWDGSGYPDRLAGEAIPLDARIVHLADVYDALTHERVYKKAWSAEEARRAIVDASGSMFDPEIVRAFEQIPR